MNAVVEFFQAHWDELCAAFTALITFCTIVVKLTPSQKDDAVLAKVIKVLDYLSVVNPKGTRVVKDADAGKKK